MASRMEKYHSNTFDVKTRSVKNESLYRDIYENVHYSNIEGVTTLDKTNEIDLAKIQELLKEREQFKKRNDTVKRENTRVRQAPIVEDRNYDIRDILVKAKDEKIVDNGTRSFRNIEYNILKNIDVKNINEKKSAAALEKTLSRTGFLDEIKDQDLCLDMLSDLRSSGDTIADKSSGVQDLLREVSEAKDKYEPKADSDDNLDKSFYTSSLNFKEDDFEHLKDIQDSIDSNNKMIKVLFSLLVIVILAVIGFVIFKFL